MKIGFFADGPWAHRTFEKLIQDKTIKIMFIMVRYDKRDPILLQLAKDYGIPAEICDNVNSGSFIEHVREYGADLFVSMSFNQIFKTELINLPKYKTINCHAGKLPFYRGRNILNWALINDEKEFGITVHYMDEGIDTGDIILQETYPITEEDDYRTLLLKAYDGCASVLYKAIKMIQDNNVNPINQVEIDPIGTYCGMRQPGDEIIDWSQRSRDIFNFIRALCTPGPRAASWIRGNRICINKAKMIPGAHVYKNIAGQVIGKTSQGFIVKTGDSSIEIIEYEYAGKIRVGDRLQDHE